MRPLLVSLAATLALSIPLGPTALAQDGPELNVQCLTVSGEVPTEGSREFGLEDAIASGSVSLEAVEPSEACAAPAEGTLCVTIAGTPPAGGWEPTVLAEAISTRRANVVLVAAAAECSAVVADTFGSSEPVEPVEPIEVTEPGAADPITGAAPVAEVAPPEISDGLERLPLQVIDSGFGLGEFSSTFVALVVNPNLETWAASAVPATVRILDSKGSELETLNAFATLLPGQVGAVVGFLTTSAEPDALELTFEVADFNWVSSDLSPDALVVSKVKRPKDQAMGFTTTGRIRNDSSTTLENVTLVAVHRNKAGRIIGSDFDWLASLGPGEAQTFEIANLSGVPRKRVAETEIYVSLTSIP